MEENKMPTGATGRDQRHRLDEYQNDTRYCEECCRQRAFAGGQCVACVARRHATPATLIAQAIRTAERMKSAAFHEFCQMVER